jgi:hypothetical protein
MVGYQYFKRSRVIFSVLNQLDIMSCLYFTGYAESIIEICTDKTRAIKFLKTLLTKHGNNYSLTTSFSS